MKGGLLEWKKGKRQWGKRVQRGEKMLQGLLGKKGVSGKKIQARRRGNKQEWGGCKRRLDGSERTQTLLTKTTLSPPKYENKTRTTPQGVWGGGDYEKVGERVTLGVRKRGVGWPAGEGNPVGGEVLMSVAKGRKKP